MGDGETYIVHVFALGTGVPGLAIAAVMPIVNAKISITGITAMAIRSI
jgi:hypothetical protein